MTGFKLINPYIEGNMKTYVDTDNVENAAKILYTELSKNFANNIPQYMFSLRDSENKIHNFKVCEKCNTKERNGSHVLDVKLQKIKFNNTDKINDFYEKMVKENNEQKGSGKKFKFDFDSSDSSDSSDSDTSHYYEYYRPLKKKQTFPISKHIMYVPNDYMTLTNGLVYNPVFYYDYYNPVYSILKFETI